MNEDDERTGSGEPTNCRDMYKELCASYRAIDDFRAKLLGFLPLVTGAGVSVLLKMGCSAAPNPQLLPVGIFGSVVTLGLLFYEVYGIRKCHALILAGRELETSLKVKGQFLARPRSVLGINEPIAAAVVYSATLAAWLWLGTSGLSPADSLLNSLLSLCLPFFGFCVPLVWMLVYNERLKRDAFLYELTGQLLLAEAEKREDVLKRLRTDNPKKNQALLPPESKKDDRYWVREIRLKGTGPAAVVKCSVRILPNTLAIPIEREVTFAWDPSREVWRLQEVGWPTNS